MTAVLEAEVRFGSTTPRLSTRPLDTNTDHLPPGPCGCGCALTPATSRGFEAVEFTNEVLKVDLLPWQRWWLIHALELASPERLRFRTVMTLVARQNGKTTLTKILTLWAMYMGHARLALGAAQDLKIARESWQGAVDLAKGVDDLSREIANVRYANGEQCMTLEDGSRYMITAATRSAGRGLSVDLLILDELREQRDWAAWGALSKTTLARPDSLTVGISNQGDDQSVVLNSLRSAALAESDPHLAIFEWSAPDEATVNDVDAWVQANPGMGRTITESAIRAACATDPAATFRTEVLCQRVDVLDAAVQPDSWRACAEPGSTLAPWARQMTLCADVSYDDHHVTLAAAAPDEQGTIRGEILGWWSSTAEARAFGTPDKPGLFEMLAMIRPRAVAWFPSGPAAILGADLTPLHGECVGRRVFALVGDEMAPEAPGVVPLTTNDAMAACQGLADLVDSRAFIHPDDDLLNAHIFASVRKNIGDGWRFARRDARRNDAAYAMAGAVHLARTLPPVEDYDLLSSVF